jgi:Plasma-membrane choline transporter
MFVLFPCACGAAARAPGQPGCVDAQGQQIACCMWQPNAWALTYIPINAVALLWTVFFFGQLRVYVVSGTVGQWYFKPAGVRTQVSR